MVPEQPEMLQLANGDIVESAPPIWGMDIKVCGNMSIEVRLNWLYRMIVYYEK